MERYVEIQLPHINGPWFSKTRLDPGVRIESQGGLENSCDPVNPSCLRSALVLGPMMDLNLQLGSGETVPHAWERRTWGITENPVLRG